MKRSKLEEFRTGFEIEGIAVDGLGAATPQIHPPKTILLQVTS